MPDLQCPRCGKRLTFERVGDLPHFPFCSRRCRLIDLDAWFEEERRISSPLPSDLGIENADLDSDPGDES